MFYLWIIKNDKIGSPNIFNFEGKLISSGVLIHTKILLDIIKYFKNINSIIEIGSGYGGQCKILNDYFHNINYTCIDQPNCLNLCKTYLNKLKLNNINFVNINNINQMSADLVISNYCLSELDEKGIDFYFNKIIKFTKNIYFAVGNYRENLSSHKFLINKCREYFNIKIYSENPRTSNHNNIYIVGTSK